MPRPGGPGRGHKRKTGNGPGWGGPAKGAGSTRKALPLIGDEAPQPPPEAKSAGRKRSLDRAEEMRAVLYSIAREGEHEANRLNAAFKLHTLLEPMPKQAIEHSGEGLTINVVQRGKPNPSA